jgi:hypothetical protein
MHRREAVGISVLAPSYDATGEKATAVKARYVGVCRGCGAYTQPRTGKGDAYEYCKRCHPGAIEQRWTPERVLGAMRQWRERYGRLPSSYDWSRTHAYRRGGGALERLTGGEWPAASVVGRLFGSWAAARTAASGEDVDAPLRGGREPGRGGLGTQTICVPNRPKSPAKCDNRRRCAAWHDSIGLQGFLAWRGGCARYSGR